MKKAAPLSRRRFLASSTAATAFMFLPRRVLGMRGAPSPNNKLNIAGIGIGSQGASDLEDVGDENIVALCDVDWDYAADTFKTYPKARRYRDFRQMLDKEKGIDAVVVGTPDHAHAIVSVTAMRAGKHVYCEKPLTRTVREARTVASVARETKLVTQMGNQGMAFEGNRLINEWLWDGAIGHVREVHAWSDSPTHWGKPSRWAHIVERPSDMPPVPPNLDWNLWLGPAPWRPYHPAYVPGRWRKWWDFGSGALGDMGIHDLAPVFSALKLGAPEYLSGSSSPVYPETLPAASTVHYHFPARGGMPPVELHWYDGGLLPERPEELGKGEELDPEDGILFVGDKGKMLVTGWGGARPRLLPASLDKEYKRPPKTLPRVVGADQEKCHRLEWVQACKTGSPTRSNFGFAGPLTEAVLLGTVCIRNGGGRIFWDSENLKTDDPDANKYLDYEHREGWKL